jgi:hypothetical protein
VPTRRPRTSQVKRYRTTPPTRDSYSHAHGSEACPTLHPGKISALLDALDSALINIARKFRVPVSTIVMLASDRDRVRRGD